MLHFRSFARYSAAVTLDQTHPAADFPKLWLLSDARNDTMLDEALQRLPHGSALIYRHYHLSGPARRKRFDALSAIARSLGHWIILSADAATAHQWDAEGIYGPPQRLTGTTGLIRLATVHDEGEIAAANRIGADAALLSPVFPTRSHPGGVALGPARFRELAQLAEMPVIALGGMTPETAQKLGWPRWAAIDGLVSPKDS